MSEGITINGVMIADAKHLRTMLEGKEGKLFLVTDKTGGVVSVLPPEAINSASPKRSRKK